MSGVQEYQMSHAPCTARSGTMHVGKRGTKLALNCREASSKTMESGPRITHIAALQALGLPKSGAGGDGGWKMRSRPKEDAV